MGGDCCWIVRHIRRLLSAEDEQQKIPWKFTILLDRLCQLQSEQSDDVRMRKGRRRMRRFGIRIPPVLAQMKGKFYFNFTLLLFSHRHGRRRSRSRRFTRNNHHPLHSLTLTLPFDHMDFQFRSNFACMNENEHRESSSSETMSWKIVKIHMHTW